MLEIIWHGRGGQGAFTAAKLLGAAFSLSSSTAYALAFPSFGPERRGAPIRAFTKLDTKPIGNRSEVDSADLIVLLDDTLFSPNLFNYLKPAGKILINSKHHFDNPAIFSINATHIATETLHMPIVNTIMLGALVARFTDIPYEFITQAIEAYMPAKLQQKNIAAVLTVKEAWQKETAR